MQYSLKRTLNFINIKDIAHLVLAMLILPWALIAKIFIRHFWLICEDKNEARDNGYWLYKWIRENHPEQRIAYAINKKSPDYSKVKDLGKTIGYGTISHWFWYIVADKNISSQKGGKPNAAVCYLFEVVLKLRKNNRVFLQHGVTINKGDWLYYKNTKIRYFITAAQEEHSYILEHFGYPKENVKLCGFARFDSLHDATVDKDLILVMPSWRNWLGRASRSNRELIFSDTEYCKRWNELIQSEALHMMLEKYDKKLVFYPHRNMQKFLSDFSTSSPHIEIADWKNYDVQTLLKTAALLITDYSSVFFDFSYMRKPVIFYQFDEQEFREKQYAEGCFNYHDHVLGEWADTLTNVLSLLENSLSKDCPKIESAIIKQFFNLWDNQNCERIYNAIR